MNTQGLYFDTRISSNCGECGKLIIKGALTACIHRGGQYGQSKAFHIICAIKAYENNIKECKKMIKHAGQRRNPKVSF